MKEVISGIEDLEWLDTTLAGLPDTEQVFFYSNFPDENGIDNLFEISKQAKYSQN